MQQPISAPGSFHHLDPLDALPNSFGRLHLHETEATYVGSDHWAAVIDGVRVSCRFSWALF